MSETDSKRTRIADKIAASQARLRRDTPPALPSVIPPAEPPESFSGLVRQYPGLIVVGGLALGVVAGALMPRALRSKLTGRVVTLAGLAGELGLALGRQALDKAEAGREKMSEGTQEARSRATRIAGTAAGSARGAGIRIAEQAIKLARNARR